MQKFRIFLEAEEKQKTHYLVHDDTGIRRGPYSEEEALDRHSEGWSVMQMKPDVDKWNPNIEVKGYYWGYPPLRRKRR